MKKQSVFLYVLRLSLTLLVITSLMAAALAGVNAITKDRIAAITKEKTDKAIAEVLPDAEYVYDKTDVFKKSRVFEVPDMITKIYMAYDGPATSSIDSNGGVYTGEYAIELVPSGFDGEITMMVGIDAEGKVIAISIINHTETAGLGAVAAANSATGKAFREQFAGMSGELAVSKDGGEVDALTGATITSRAITEGVNVALEFVAQLREHGFT